MKNLFLSISLLLSSSLYSSEGYPVTLKPPSIAGNVMGTTIASLDTLQILERNDSARYVYAELVFVRNYGEVKLWVEGKWVSQKIRTEIMATKFRDEALDILGNDGWDLTATTTRELDGGFEFFFYLKKKIG